jgi:DNA-binding transcriptional LysR family regulator
MNIKNLEVFLKTVDLGSLTKAAHVMGYTQSAASHIIAGLEDELGLSLLVRRRDGVHITSEGERLLPIIRNICQMSQDLFQHAAQFQGLETGTIRIGTIFSVSVHILPLLLQEFMEDHPCIRFELRQGNYQDIEQWLQSGTVDLGFSRRPAGGAFEVIPLLRERFFAIFPSNHSLEADTFSMEELQKESYILRPESLEGELFDLLKSTSYQPKITYSAKDDYAVMAMVEQGLGMSILPELLIRGTVHHFIRKDLTPPVYRELCLAYRKDQQLSPASNRFVQYVKGHDLVLRGCL